MSMGSVLLTDDDELIRRLLQPHLERAGFRTLLADNGARAIELIAAEAPEHIILDIAMPQIDGLALLRLLKSTTSTCSIPVIIISSAYERAFQEEAKIWGAMSYLTKPFSPAQLLAEVLRVVDSGG
jgi:DNA-binding response OmpR family regulator